MHIKNIEPTSHYISEFGIRIFRTGGSAFIRAFWNKIGRSATLDHGATVKHPLLANICVRLRFSPQNTSSIPPVRIFAFLDLGRKKEELLEEYKHAGEVAEKDLA